MSRNVGPVTWKKENLIRLKDITRILLQVSEAINERMQNYYHIQIGKLMQSSLQFALCIYFHFVVGLIF